MTGILNFRLCHQADFEPILATYLSNFNEGVVGLTKVRDLAERRPHEIT